MGDLVVELYGVRIGTLVGDTPSFDFVTEPGAVARFGLDSQILSVTVPLSIVPPRTNRARRRNFFIELLPEGRMLTQLAQMARVSTGDAIGLLRRFGRDVAGALQIWDPDSPGEPKEPWLKPLGDEEVARLLTNTQDFPLGNRPTGGRARSLGRKTRSS